MPMQANSSDCDASSEPTPAEVAQFEKTRALVAGLPRACP